MSWPLLVPLITAILAASLALACNYWLQYHAGRRIRDADEVRRRLYEFLALVSEYWMANQRDTELEPRIVAMKWIVLAELRRLQSQSRHLRRWYDNTEAHRLDMMDAATGGCFQQESWAPDHDRALQVAREMRHILDQLHQAC